MHTMQFIKEVSAANWIGILFLAAASCYDIRCRRIPVKLIIAAAIAAAYLLLRQRDNIEACLAGAAIGMLLLLAGRVSGERIGYGDGMAFVITGLLLGIRQNVMMLCISLLFSTIYSLWILLSQKGNRKTEIPFLPCMLAGCIVVTALRI